MKAQNSSSISTLKVAKPQAELKGSLISDDKLGDMLNQIALLPCPEKNSVLGFGTNGM